METSYRKLFSISVTHEYFGGRPCPDLALEPDADTARIMRGYRMRLRPETGGASLFTAAKQGGAAALPPEPLQFLLTVREPLFYQYTDMEADARPDASVAVFDSGETFQDADRPDDTLLAEPGKVRTKPVQGSEPGTFVPLSRPAAGVFGVVTVHVQQWQEPPRFVIPLAAVQARWRYLVAGADDDARIEGSALAAGKAIAFGQPEPAEIAGRKALVFESADAYPILADPRGVYTVKLTAADGHERLLPLPSVTVLRAAGPKGDGMVAEMIVLAERVA